MNTTRRLYRNTREGKIGGVAAGLGDYFAVDPVILRLAFVLLVLAGGFGLLAYLVAWIVIPAGDAEATPAGTTGDRRWDGGLVLGVLLAAVGAVALLGWWVDGWSGNWWEDGGIWPLLLIGAGVVLVLWRRDRRQGRSAGPEPGGGGKPDGPGPSGGGPGSETSTLALEPASTVELEPGDTGSTEDADGATAPSASGGYIDDTRPYGMAGAARVEARRRYPVGWITLGAILAAGAVSALLDVLGAVDVTAQEFLIVALGLAGVGVVAGALLGRVWGPLALGVATAFALAAVSLPDAPVHGGVGDKTVRPSTTSELQSVYRLGAGNLVLDLRSLTLTPGDHYVEASVAYGRLVVLVPDGTAVDADGQASVGQVDLFGREEGGVGVETSASESPPLGTPPLGRLHLDVAVGVGRVETRFDAA